MEKSTPLIFSVVACQMSLASCTLCFNDKPDCSYCIGLLKFGNFGSVQFFDPPLENCELNMNPARVLRKTSNQNHHFKKSSSSKQICIHSHTVTGTNLAPWSAKRKKDIHQTNIASIKLEVLTNTANQINGHLLHFLVSTVQNGGNTWRLIGP